MKKLIVILMILMLSTFFTTISIGYNGKSLEIKNLIPRNFDDPDFTPIPGDLPLNFQIPTKQLFSYKNLPHHNIQLQISSEEIIELIEKLDVEIVLGYLENLTSFGPRVTGT